MKTRCRVVGLLIGLPVFFATSAPAKDPGQLDAIKLFKAIHIALGIYANNHDGDPPPALEDLVPAYLPAEALIDPYSKQPIQYAPSGQKWQSGDFGNRIIAFAAWTGDRGMVLGEDGHVSAHSQLPAGFKPNPMPLPDPFRYMRWSGTLYLAWLAGSVVSVGWWFTVSRKRWRLGRRLVTALLSLAALVILPALLLWRVAAWRAGIVEHEHQVWARRQLELLSAALQAHANQHRAQMPATLAELVPEFLHDTRQLVGYRMRSPWLYYGDGKAWGATSDRTNEIIVSCGTAYDGRYVLDSAGQIRQLENADFVALLPERLRPTPGQ